MLSLENAFVYNTLKSSEDTQTPYKTRTLFHSVIKLLTCGKNLKNNYKVSYIVSCGHGAFFVWTHLPDLLNLL